MRDPFMKKMIIHFDMFAAIMKYMIGSSIHVGDVIIDSLHRRAKHNTQLRQYLSNPKSLSDCISNSKISTSVEDLEIVGCFFAH